MTEDLAVVHAYLCADGYVVKNSEKQKHKYYRLGLRNTNEVLLNDFQERFEKVFSLKPRIVQKQRSEIGSKEIYKKMTEQFGSFYSWHWTMPQLEKNELKCWLRAYFDCEGWVTCKSHQNRMIGADCVNERGIKQIQRGLKIIGIESKIKKRNTRNIFSLNIFGKKNLIKFHEEINFLHPEKKEKLEKTIKDFMNYEWNFENIEKILEERAKIKKPMGTIRILSKLKTNLLSLQKKLLERYKINSKINKCKNGLGNVYYELNINKKEEVKYLINNQLLAVKEKEKWLKLQK
jgi:hypothetical protein